MKQKKNINISELPAILEVELVDDKTLDAKESFRWGTVNEAEYKKVTDYIDKIDYTGNGWKIYAWYDISGYDYWMENMKESNYIQITLRFDSKQIPQAEVPLIKKALENALYQAYYVEQTYDFNPGSYEDEYSTGGIIKALSRKITLKQLFE